MSTLNVALVVFGALTALFMLGGGVAKVTGQPAMRESAQHFAIQWEHYRFLGVVEIAAAVGVVAGLWLNGLGLAAGVGVIGTDGRRHAVPRALRRPGEAVGCGAGGTRGVGGVRRLPGSGDLGLTHRA